MISNISLIIFSLLFVNIIIVVQSAPVENPSIIISDVKKKRHINDDMIIKHKLHPKMKETPAQIHDNVEESVDTDDFKVFTDMKMNPDELINLVRKRRNIHFNDRSNSRHKRALSTYDLYNTDPFYGSLIEREQFIRPTRAFAPIYWYPPLYKRHIRSSFDEPSEWNKIYANTIENDDINEDQIPFFLNNDDENLDEYNRYPLLLDPSYIPYDNLQLQQEYNIDDLPIDENEGYFSTRYGPIEIYVK